MSNLRASRFAAATAALLIAVSASAAGPDEFYELQLRAGKSDYQARRMQQAADELRVAAFGFLDQPPRLAEALVRLAVVQNALGLKNEVGKTLERFVEVEKRFAPYRTLSIETQIKSAFETLALNSLSADTVLSVPALRRISVDAQLQRIAALPERKRISAYQELAERDPKNPEWPLALTREYAARDAFKEVIQWGTRALDLDSGNPEPRALVAHARASSHACREALALLSDALLNQRPELYADQTICLAEAGRWTEARKALASVPNQFRNRPDVRRAEKLIAANNAGAPSSKSMSPKVDPTRTTAPRPVAPKSPDATPKPSDAAPKSSEVASKLPDAAPKSSEVAPKSSEVLELTRKLNHDGKFADSLRRLLAAIDADPSNRALRLAVVEAAVLSRAYQTAAAQIPSVMPLVQGEELYMFYASVALYETGRKSEAKPLMERARPSMLPGPMVDYYIRAILG